MIIVILIIGLILRLISLNQSLWLDEGINVNNVSALSFKSLILNYTPADFHPPGYHIILKLWIMLAGNSEIAVRIPSVIFGIITVYCTYLIGKKLFEEKTALIGATLMATSPLAIYYSQEARMYSMAAAFCAASIYFFISLIKKDRLLFWTGFIVSTSLMLYSDYLPYLLIPVYIFYLLLNKKTIAKHTLKTFIPALIIIFIILVPWLLIFPRQIHTGLSAAAASPAWAQVVGAPQLKNIALVFVKFTIGRISIGNKTTYALVFAPIALFITFLFSFSFFRISRQRAFLHYWLFLPIAAAYVISFFVPVFAYFRFLFVLPAFYLIIASAINIIYWPPLVRFLLAIFLTINITSTLIYFSNPQFQREDWRTATAYVVQNSAPDTITLFESNYTMGPFDYYNKGEVKAEGGLDSFNPDPSLVHERVKNLTAGKKKVFLFQYLSQITDPQGLIFKELSQNGFVNSVTKDFPGVGFLYEFVK